ncbi:cysteine hydrolase [Aquimarina sp. I32.4]|uniref:cysteine hydrolase n=1 Tax=Aquimarina sp. I32.4 TaxID=2053903 RepID=UPI000CDEF88C|nr:cysteine hydrolase [Aquimarina sp. I32.4]
MKLQEKKPTLILVDVQKTFLDEEYWGGNRNNKKTESICGIILNKGRELNLPIFHVRHSSTDINSKLHKLNKGFEFNEHVQPTARMVGNFRYDRYLISDATATFYRIGINREKYDSETIHLTTFANFNEEFATIYDSEKLMMLL